MEGIGDGDPPVHHNLGRNRKRHKETQLKTLLEDLGLKQHYPKKLTLSEILQIDLKAITDEPAKSHSDLPWL
ncbi:unnamed protein product [Pleuronectes platessa]|uniref:Uncharacterized protein n=1 Tax=Pleuronectes platessa TaxID=8262 RepID=A0A9N7UQ71_PLEPL|nr:unnamed protein product [Pleuronectes platessa]